MSQPAAGELNPESQPRPPSMFDALLPVLVLIGFIALSVYLFGLDATAGPLQVAIFTSMAIAGLIAHKNGYSYPAIGEAVIGGISTAMGAIFILLAVGALIGTWNMVGTIPTIVDLGLGLLSPNWFYVAVVLICAITGSVTGSSWTTAGTLGVAFVGIARIMGLSPEIAAGAAISGAYFGDKVSPLSETTILVPSLVGGHTVQQHIRTMMWTVGPSLGLSLIIFQIISWRTHVSSSALNVDQARATLGESYNTSLVCLLPLVLLVVLSVVRFPAFLSIFLTAVFSGVLAIFTQHDLVIRFADDPDLSTPLAAMKAIYAAMANGFVSTTGVEQMDTLFSGGGMSGMLTTVWLILGALGFGAIMEQTGSLSKLVSGVLGRARSGGALVATVIGTALGLNIIAADQYIAIVIPSRTFRMEFKRRGYRPWVLSRVVEDSGTVTSVLIPWNTCGAYHTGVLGVSTFEYLPYCFFNIINPILSLVYGFTGFKMDKFAPGEMPPGDEVVMPPLDETLAVRSTESAS